MALMKHLITTLILLGLIIGYVPSLVSKLAPIQRRGLALGVYNSSQSLGIFVGGSLGGLIANFYGYQGTFLFCSLLIMIWFILSISMKMPIKKMSKIINITNSN